MNLCDATIPFGASWGSDDTIVYGQPEGIMRVSANGGTPELVVPAEASEQVHGPQMLPGGEWVLFTLTSAGGPTRWDEAQIVAQSLESGERKILWEGGSDARYVPTGHLVYALEDVLFALPFDLASLEVSGGPVPIVEGVRRGFTPQVNTATAHYRFSDNGTLIYSPQSGAGGYNLVWVDREGQENLLTEEPRPFTHIRLSPNGQQVVLDMTRDIWIYDVERGTLIRLTNEGDNSHPVWTLDGRRVAFNDFLGNLHWQMADGSGEKQEILKSQNSAPGLRFGSQEQQPTSWTPDGRILAFEALTADTGFDIRYFTIEGDATSEPFLVTPFDERSPMISPNGRWVAYISDESGQDEIYVQPFPEGGQRWLISTGGGKEPMWSRDGGELFYRNGNQMMAVAADTEPGFSAGTSRLLFEGLYSLDGPAGHPRYGTSPDGQHFLLSKPAESEEDQINVVLNWFEELKRLAPTN